MKTFHVSNKVPFILLYLIFLVLLPIAIFHWGIDDQNADPDPDQQPGQILRQTIQTETRSLIIISPRQITGLRINKETKEGKWKEPLQTVEECGCQRKFLFSPPGGKHAKRLNSTCSDEASFYEPGQRVITLSMSINNPNDTKRVALYTRGITENLQRLKEFYPGSAMRLYTDVNLEQGSQFCRLLCHNPELHWCDIRKIPSLGDQSSMFLMTWRFLPLGDPTVDYFLSRDLDSVIIERQVAAVNEWLQSDKPIHVMRDHPSHVGQMLGGLWGARNSLLGMKTGETLRSQIVTRAKRCPKKYGDDQHILTQVIFLSGAKNILAFDSYFCKAKWAKVSEVRPFPIRRKDSHTDFAGNPSLGKGQFPLVKCPRECRPKYGKDWDYC